MTNQSNQSADAVNQGGKEAVAPIFKVPPENLCLHDYQPAIDLVKELRYRQCIHCGKKIS